MTGASAFSQILTPLPYVIMLMHFDYCCSHLRTSRIGSEFGSHLDEPSPSSVQCRLIGQLSGKGNPLIYTSGGPYKPSDRPNTHSNLHQITQKQNTWPIRGKGNDFFDAQSISFTLNAYFAIQPLVSAANGFIRHCPSHTRLARIHRSQKNQSRKACTGPESESSSKAMMWNRASCIESRPHQVLLELKNQ